MGKRREQAQSEARESQKDRGSFAVAPMAPIYVLITGMILAIPTIWLIIIFYRPEMRDTALAMAALFIAIAVLTWVFLRPSRFVVDERALRVVWPLRSLEIELASISSVRVLRRHDLAPVLGRPWRVAVGGLFGNFGMLWTSKRGWISTYLTTTDSWVLVERRGKRPILLSPADPSGFIRALS